MPCIAAFFVSAVMYRCARRAWPGATEGLAMPGGCSEALALVAPGHARRMLRSAGSGSAGPCPADVPKGWPW